MKKLFAKYIAILLPLQLMSWWLFYYSPFNIPKYIPETPINIPGLVLILLIWAVLHFFEREVLRNKPSASISQLGASGIVLVFLSELFFQSIRLPTIEADSFSEKLYYAGVGIISMPIFAGIFSFLIAYRLKKSQNEKSIHPVS